MRRQLKPLHEQVIVVTGASSGIGLTIACRAAAAGAAVVLAARNEEALDTICQGIRDSGGRCETVVADVGELADVERISELAHQKFGGFDTWVNNAGVGAYATLEEMALEDHERLFRTNYWGVVHGSLVALKTLKQRGGALINMGSIVSEMPQPLLSAYAASKHAVKGFTDSLRIELLHEDAPVEVTLIQPSGIDTPFGEHALNEMGEKSQIPPPLYAPELVADVVLHAAQHPTRNIVVGGVGRAMIAASRLAPALSDRLFATVLHRALRKPGEPPRSRPPSLHRAGRDGKRHGDQGYQLRHSLYTSAMLRPGISLGVLGGVAALAMALLSPSKRGYSPPRRASTWSTKRPALPR